MGWTTAKTWTTGETVTAALMNEQIRDNMDYIYNASGTTVGKRVIEIPVYGAADAVTTGDGKGYLIIPVEYNGYNLTNAQAGVISAATAGLLTTQIARIRSGVTADMLTTRITIDANENTSYTAAAAAVIGTANDDVATGDILRVDNDVAGTTCYGQVVILTFQLP